ncbi:MAG: hypothetical protein ACOVNY_10585, partial [Chitinophagaceae bacterium]
MRWHLYVSRLAFICNMLFLYCLLVTKTKDFIDNKDVNSIVIILGWFISPFLNMVVNFLGISLLLQKKTGNTPKWLLIVNWVIF